MQAAPRSSWIDDEAPLGAQAWRSLKRLLRRARPSAPIWIVVAVALSAGMIWRASRVKPQYEATVVVRVSEGGVDATGAALSGGALRGYVGEFAFSSANLLQIMERHPQEFPDVSRDSVSALAEFRDAMSVTIGDSDLIEDRGPNDPPRAARIALEFRAPDPETAWVVVHELRELLVGSTRAGQKAEIEGFAAAARAALQRSQTDLAQLMRNPNEGNKDLISAARDRWRAAQATEVRAELSVRAVAGRQTLRFEMISPGRKPEWVNRSSALATGFVTTLLVLLIATGLLAGAFDPRVLEADDLGSTNLGFLGRFPPLPTGAPFGEGGGPGRRV